jgi:hypothetical protein
MGRTKLAEAYVKVDYKDLNNLDTKIDQTGRKFVDQTGNESESKDYDWTYRWGWACRFG